MKKSSLSQTSTPVLRRIDHLPYYKRERYLPPTNQSLYERRLGEKNANTFRKKKQSTYHELNYTSRQNPFANGKHIHCDKMFKDLHEKKKKIPPASYNPTDPLNLKFEKQKSTRIRPEWRNTPTLQIQLQKKYEIPAARVLSEPHKQYHSQIGFSECPEYKPFQSKKLSTHSSSNMASILQPNLTVTPEKTPSQVSSGL